MHVDVTLFTLIGADSKNKNINKTYKIIKVNIIGSGLDFGDFRNP